VRIDPLAASALAASGAVYGTGLWRLWRAAGVGQGITRREAACYGAGWCVLGLTLMGPLDTLSDVLFSAHMGQHELLMLVVAPLLVLGRPGVAALWAWPRRPRGTVASLMRRPGVRAAWRGVTAPLAAVALHGLVLWAWHAPALFEAALRSENVHAVQHFTFFATAALMWWTLVQGRYGRMGYGMAAVYVWFTALHSGLLGALVTVAPAPLYPTHEHRTALLGRGPLEDQQLAGLIMWIPAGALLTAFGLALFAVWMGEARRRAGFVEASTTSAGK
jgi:putative membrane protein